MGYRPGMWFILESPSKLCCAVGYILSVDEALDILGLHRTATVPEIKEAYRDLVKVWHPDRFGNDSRLRRKAEERLKQINIAYQCLQGYASAPDPIPHKTQRPDTPPTNSAPREAPQTSKHNAGTQTDSARRQPDSSTRPPSQKVSETGKKSTVSTGSRILTMALIFGAIHYINEHNSKQSSNVPNYRDAYNSGTVDQGRPQVSTGPTSQGLGDAKKQPRDFSYINRLPTFKDRTDAIAKRLASIKADPKYQALPEEKKARVMSSMYKGYVLVAYTDFHHPAPDEKRWVEANR
jgi:hypothetical protein